jgi:hypothetical protein
MGGGQGGGGGEDWEEARALILGFRGVWLWAGGVWAGGIDGGPAGAEVGCVFPESRSHGTRGSKLFPEYL